jgi:hypothetical protein
MPPLTLAPVCGRYLSFTGRSTHRLRSRSIGSEVDDARAVPPAAGRTERLEQLAGERES